MTREQAEKIVAAQQMCNCATMNRILIEADLVVVDALWQKDGKAHIGPDAPDPTGRMALARERILAAEKQIAPEATVHEVEGKVLLRVWGGRHRLALVRDAGCVRCRLQTNWESFNRLEAAGAKPVVLQDKDTGRCPGCG